MVGMKKQGAGAKAKADARGMAAKKNGARGGRSRRRKLPRRKGEWHDAATRRRAARERIPADSHAYVRKKKCAARGAGARRAPRACEMETSTASLERPRPLRVGFQLGHAR